MESSCSEHPETYPVSKRKKYLSLLLILKNVLSRLLALQGSSGPQTYLRTLPSLKLLFFNTNVSVYIA